MQIYEPAITILVEVCFYLVLSIGPWVSKVFSQYSCSTLNFQQSLQTCTSEASLSMPLSHCSSRLLCHSVLVSWGKWGGKFSIPDPSSVLSRPCIALWVSFHIVPVPPCYGSLEFVVALEGRRVSCLSPSGNRPLLWISAGYWSQSPSSPSISNKFFLFSLSQKQWSFAWVLECKHLLTFPLRTKAFTSLNWSVQESVWFFLFVPKWQPIHLCTHAFLSSSLQSLTCPQYFLHDHMIIVRYLQNKNNSNELVLKIMNFKNTAILSDSFVRRIFEC